MGCRPKRLQAHHRLKDPKAIEYSPLTLGEETPPKKGQRGTGGLGNNFSQAQFEDLLKKLTLLHPSLHSLKTVSLGKLHGVSAS